MENYSNTPAPLTPEELLRRQLRDWKELHDSLAQRQAPTDQIGYAYTQIVRLEMELSNLSAK